MSISVELSQEEYAALVEGRKKDAAVTPFFRWEKVLNVAKSEQENRDIYEDVEVVELRVAGMDKVVPVERADHIAEHDGWHQITYKEKYAEQYRQWMSGEGQVAKGTPLETLFEFGVSPAQVSACKMHKIYTVEALIDLQGQNLKSLGMEANALKDACRKYQLDRANKESLVDKVAELEAQLAAIKSQAEVEVAPISAGDPYPDKSDEELKDMIALKHGQKPRGNPKRETLIQMLTGE